MTDTNDVVMAIAASLYASRATDDAIRAEPSMEVIRPRRGICITSLSLPFEAPLAAMAKVSHRATSRRADPWHSGVLDRDGLQLVGHVVTGVQRILELIVQRLPPDHIHRIGSAGE